MSLVRAFRRDVAAAELPADLRDTAPVTSADLEALPEVARRYLVAMGAVGRPRVRSLTVAFAGRFRRTADEAWMPARALQYNTAEPITRIYTLRVLFGRVVPMIGHDTYVGGSGRMLGKVGGLFTVADGSGQAFDLGELVTYVNDAVLLAPSMLLGVAEWRQVDDSTFEVALTDHGRTVSARVFLDARGLPLDFATTDRFYDAPGGPVRCEWRTPVDSWLTADARPFPGPARATWMLPDAEPLTYVEGGFVPGSLRVNVVPRPPT